MIGEKEFQWRLAQGIKVLRREALIPQDHRFAVRDDLERARRIVIEAKLARPAQIELAFGARPVRPDLRETAGELRQAVEISVYLIDGRHSDGGG